LADFRAYDSAAFSECRYWSDVFGRVSYHWHPKDGEIAVDGWVGYTGELFDSITDAFFIGFLAAYVSKPETISHRLHVPY
jgi:hypothetical protein